MLLIARFCVLWFALMAGFFFAYDSTVMPGFAALPAEEAMRAMQHINAAVQNAWFASGFWGAILLAVIGALSALFKGIRRHLGLFAGCLLYIVGAFLVTVMANVPLNQWLATLDTSGPEAARHWANYTQDWNLWNLIRTAASFLAAMLVLFLEANSRRL